MRDQYGGYAPDPMTCEISSCTAEATQEVWLIDSNHSGDLLYLCNHHLDCAREGCLAIDPVLALIRQTHYFWPCFIEVIENPKGEDLPPVILDSGYSHTDFHTPCESESESLRHCPKLVMTRLCNIRFLTSQDILDQAIEINEGFNYESLFHHLHC